MGSASLICSGFENLDGSYITLFFKTGLLMPLMIVGMQPSALSPTPATNPRGPKLEQSFVQDSQAWLLELLGP